MKNYSIKTSLFIFLIVSLFFTSCSKNKEAPKETTAGSADYAQAEVVAEAEIAMSEPATQPKTSSNETTSKFTSTSKTEESTPNINQEKIERKLLKDGTLNWETSDVAKTHQHILAAVKKYNAYASNDEQTADDYRIVNTVEIRVTANQFDSFINDISKDVQDFDVKKISVSDVTEEYIDVAARIKTKKELEQHYYDLLKRTKTVTEILEVEQQLDIVRNDVESAEGRLKYLNDRVSLATINILFYQIKSKPIGFFGKTGKSFLEGWNGILYFVLFLLKIWPFILLATIIIFFVIRKKKKTN